MQGEDHLQPVPTEATGAYSDIPEPDLQLPSESHNHLPPNQPQAEPEPFDQGDAQHLMHSHHHHQSPLADHYHQQMSSMFMQQPASQPVLSDSTEHQRPDGMALPFPQSNLGVYAQAAEQQAAHAQAQHNLTQEAMPSQHGSEEVHYPAGSNDGMLSPNDPDRK